MFVDMTVWDYFQPSKYLPFPTILYWLLSDVFAHMIKCIYLLSLLSMASLSCCMLHLCVYALHQMLNLSLYSSLMLKTKLHLLRTRLNKVSINLRNHSCVKVSKKFLFNSYSKGMTLYCVHECCVCLCAWNWTLHEARALFTKLRIQEIYYTVKNGLKVDKIHTRIITLTWYIFLWSIAGR